MENQKLYKKYTHLIKTLNPANVTNVCEAKGAECDSFRHIYLHDKTVVENYLCKIIDTKDNGQRINKNSTVPVKESLVDLKNRSKKKKKSRSVFPGTAFWFCLSFCCQSRLCWDDPVLFFAEAAWGGWEF